MSLIDVQKLSNGELIGGGKLYIGAYGSNEPEENAITVYTDYQLTSGIDISSGVDLDQDGFPLINGVRTSLYVGVNFSLQIRDRVGASVWPLKAQQVTVMEQVEGFDPALPQKITGAWGFDLSDSEELWAGDGNPITENPTAFIAVQATASTSISALSTREAASTGGTNAIVRVYSDKAGGGSNVQMSAGNVFFNAVSDGEGANRAIIDSPNIELRGQLGFDGSAAGSTLGSVTKKKEVFDEDGASLGFIAIYDSIT